MTRIPGRAGVALTSLLAMLSPFAFVAVTT